MRTITALALLLAAPAAYGSWVYTASGTPVEIREEHVRIRIVENVAHKHIRLALRNPTAQRTEAELFFEVEPGQNVERFKVTINGKEQQGELLDSEKARKIYEEIVRKQRDPAILESYGQSLLRVRVFPIEPNSTFEAEVELVQTLKAEGGFVRVVGTNALSRQPLARIDCAIEIENSAPVGMFYSPTHAVDVTRAGPGRVRVTCDRRDHTPTSPLVLYYSVKPEPLRVMAHDGAFMLTFTPPDSAREPLPRDLVFAVDTSGSMREDRKLDQVKTALKKFLETLQPRDRFNLIEFSLEARPFRPGFVDPSDRPAANRWIDRLAPLSGTNFEDALKLALAHEFRSDAVPVVVLLTDGLPTIGERDAAKLVSQVAKGPRIFCFGVGHDVNTQLLDRLALATGGDRQYMLPGDDAAVVLESFARRIDAPVLTNPVVEIDGATEVYPRRLPDVFRGGQLVVFGRAQGLRKVTLRAGEFRQEFEVDFSANARFEFVPRLWAIQKVDFLMDEIRTHGADKELVDEVVRLSKEYLIVTPYTSFLITEDTPQTTGRAQSNFEQSYANGFTGGREFACARNQASWRGATNTEAQDRALTEALGADARVRLRQVANRNFVQRGEEWVDLAFNGKAQEISFGSDSYFDLLRNNPEAARVMSLGRNVTFQCGDTWVAVK